MVNVDTRPSAISRQPTNRNFFLPNQAEFAIRRLPSVEFFCQRAVLPGVSMQAVAQRNPLTDIRHAGDVVQFNEFEITFAVSEYLENYMAVMDWIVRLGFPEDHSQYLSLSEKPVWSGDGIKSDCSIFFLDSRGKPRVEATFRDAFPQSLSSIQVDTRADSAQFLSATASFVYTKYELAKVS